MRTVNPYRPPLCLWVLAWPIHSLLSLEVFEIKGPSPDYSCANVQKCTMNIIQSTCKSCIMCQELWPRFLAIGISTYKASTETEPGCCCSFQGTFCFPEFVLPGSNRRTATVNLLHNALFPESWNAWFPYSLLTIVSRCLSGSCYLSTWFSQFQVSLWTSLILCLCNL